MSGRVDRHELAVRFTCGALFGVLVGFGWGESAGAVATSAAVFGLLAAFLGDRFWYGIRGWF